MTTTEYSSARGSRKNPAATLPRPVALGVDPEVVARAGELLRALDRATGALTDALDVTGFPLRERQSDLALLSTLTSGLPAVTLDDLVESLRTLAAVSGPNALYPENDAEMSLPDEARELLYLVEPVAAAPQTNRRLPRYAGERLRSAALTFSLGQPKTNAALLEVIAVLRLLRQLPLQRHELTTIRRPAVQLLRTRGRRVKRSHRASRPEYASRPEHSSRSEPAKRSEPASRTERPVARVRERSTTRPHEPTRGAAIILLAMLIFVVLAAVVFYSFASNGSLPFGVSL